MIKMNSGVKYAMCILVLLGAAACSVSGQSREAGIPHSVESILKWNDFRGYIRQFNADDDESVIQFIPNSGADAFLKDNIPYFNCPDKGFEQTYYFRWWVYRKHIQKTPGGFVITEFLPKVPQAGKYNTISCPAAHHFYEGRWLRDPEYLSDYANFWFKGGGSPRSYSFWPANSILAFASVYQDSTLVTALLPYLVENYQAWEKSNLCADGLFWQADLKDGMEASIGGSGKRATINSYMTGEAMAIAAIAKIAGDQDLAAVFSKKAAHLKQLLLTKLWDAKAGFFKTLPLSKEEFAGISVPERYRRSFSLFTGDAGQLADVRELHGYTPWYFNIPGAQQSVAWKFLMDTDGFRAPFGPTTAERRHPGFRISYMSEPYICQWNGPGWPYATSITLKAMGNLLHNYRQFYVSRNDFIRILETYSKSHRLINEKGKKVFWIDENLNPFTGEWLSRQISTAKRGIHYGKDYNHSEFCDIIISDLMGIRPSMKNELVIDPLIPAGYWNWFCLDRVRYHNKAISILWDKDGSKYKKGRGFSIFINGVLKHHSASIRKVSIPL
ncbi:MGH1-like glycoside hydrolase domain-containing protein [Niabella aurantiaca]|uniref:MGH1-like glycoside hydrolase domain-containing protein n=1 Tax=Niabella aurantiaca TaxID=379900 RepID=UPI0003646DD4|nr:glycosyl hydrolase family 65 protein [Niabella aurantiaca]